MEIERLQGTLERVRLGPPTAAITTNIFVYSWELTVQPTVLFAVLRSSQQGFKAVNFKLSMYKKGGQLGWLPVGLQFACLEESSNVTGGFVSRNWVELFDCAGKGVLEAPHRSGLEFFVRRVEVVVMH